MRHNQHSGLEDELVHGNPDRRVHLAIGSFLGHPHVSSAEDSAKRDTVLLLQALNRRNDLGDSEGSFRGSRPGSRRLYGPNVVSARLGWERVFWRLVCRWFG